MITEITLDIDDIAGVSPYNVRQADQHGDLTGLKATISAAGLLQRISVHRQDGAYLVFMGGRRWKSCRELADEGQLFRRVEAVLYEGYTPAELRTFSAMENTQQLAMHPVREYEAFAAIAASSGAGQDPVDTIAREFGLTRQHVRQRLALGGLSPKIRAAWLAGELSAEAAKAYAEADDIAAQEAVFDGAANWERDHPASIRRTLLADTITGADKIAQFVGADAYVAAGGILCDSLFVEEQRFNRALVEKLALDKLHAAAEAVRQSEGWGFAVTSLDDDSNEYEPMDDFDPDYLPGDETRLEEIRKALQTTVHPPECAALEREAAEIEAKAICRALPATERTTLAVMAEVDWRGDLNIIRALVPPDADDDAASPSPLAGERDARSATDEGDDEGDNVPRAKTPRLEKPAPLPPAEPIGKALRTVLDETASGALHAVASRSVNFALICAVAALGSGGLAITTIDLKIHTRRSWAPAHDLLENISHLSFAQALEIVAAAPFNDVTTAFCELIGASIDTSRDEKLDGGLALIRVAASQSAILQDLQKNFSPELYFNAATRDAAIAAIRDTEGQASAAEATGLKKKDLAERAALTARDFNWLPKLLQDAATTPEPAPVAVSEAKPSTPDTRSTAEAMLDALQADNGGDAETIYAAIPEGAVETGVAAVYAGRAMSPAVPSFDPAKQKSDIAGFLEHACDRTNPDARIKAQTLYNAYINWAALRGYEPIYINLFGVLMRDAGIDTHRLSAGVHYLGVALKIPATEQEAAQ